MLLYLKFPIWEKVKVKLFRLTCICTKILCTIFIKIFFFGQLLKYILLIVGKQENWKKIQTFFFGQEKKKIQTSGTIPSQIRPNYTEPGKWKLERSWAQNICNKRWALGWRRSNWTFSSGPVLLARLNP